MKKLIITSIVIFISQFLFAQDDTTAVDRFCMVTITVKSSNKVTVAVDHGQEQSVWQLTEKLKDETGKVIKFNSTVDALNHMAAQGWQFINSTVNAYNEYAYLFKRRVKKP